MISQQYKARGPTAPDDKEQRTSVGVISAAPTTYPVRVTGELLNRPSAIAGAGGDSLPNTPAQLAQDRPYGTIPPVRSALAAPEPAYQTMRMPGGTVSAPGRGVDVMGILQRESAINQDIARLKQENFDAGATWRRTDTGQDPRTADFASAMRTISDPNTAPDVRRNLTQLLGDKWGPAAYKPAEIAADLKGQELRNSGALATTALSGRDALARQVLSDQAAGSRQAASDATALDRVRLQGQFGLLEGDARNQTALEAARIGGANQLEAARIGAAPKAFDYRTQLPELFKAAADYGGGDQLETAKALRLMLEQLRPSDGVEKKAAGGLVRGTGTPTVQSIQPDAAAYREYVVGAQRMGLPPVSFDQYISLKVAAQTPAPAPQQYSAMGFNMGGLVPELGYASGGMVNANDASGKLVVDTNPNAPTDSIPAVVDGQAPAALDSGEFVIPADVVRFFGTDKLDKMIAQARAGSQPQR